MIEAIVTRVRQVWTALYCPSCNAPGQVGGMKCSNCQQRVPGSGT